MKKSKTIVLIHGLFVNNKSWAQWKAYFEAKGYTVHTPANPGHEGNPADLRTNVHPDLTKVGFEDVVMNIARFIDTLPEKPIVIGHSLAGLVVLKLVEMDKAVVGVSIDGAPPKNILAPLHTIKAVLPVVNPFKGRSPYLGTKAWYRFAFFNTLTEAEANKAYEAVAVPESRKIAWDTLLSPFANVNLKKPHNPLLFIGGEKDNIFSAGFTKKIAGSYKDRNSVTDFKEFKGRSHYIAGEPGWEEVADYVANWIEKQ